MFTKLCPYYISCGMSYDEYWNDDPWKAQAYYKAQKLINERTNQQLWLQGLYVYNAFGVVFANAFAKKGSSPKKYVEEPIRIYPETEEEKAAKQKKAMDEATAFFNSMIKKQKIAKLQSQKEQKK